MRIKEELVAKGSSDVTVSVGGAHLPANTPANGQEVEMAVLGLHVPLAGYSCLVLLAAHRLSRGHHFFQCSMMGQDAGYLQVQQLSRKTRLM